MKVIAFFMVICMGLVSVVTGTVQAIQYDKEPKCCMLSGMAKPCKSHKSNKVTGMCLTKLCCNVSGFIINKVVQIVQTAPVEVKNSSVNPMCENTIDFSFSFWHPPKVVLI
ncbi:hypothetical protein FHT21_001099 [Pedobacter sp. SG908]|nr:hypothetical protein [Pedobacter sp. SG908]